MRKRKIEREDLEAFETASNAACKSIAKNEYGQAEVLLKRAKGKFILMPFGLNLTSLFRFM